MRALMLLTVATTAFGGTVSYGDLGPGNTFSTTQGWCVSGDQTPNCGPEVTRTISAPFTPTADLTLSTVQLALGFNSGSTNSATVTLSGSAGPGTLGGVIERWNPTNLPGVGVDTLTANPNTVLMGGQTYWITASATGDTLDFWFLSPYTLGGGLTAINGATQPLSPANYQGNTLPAFAVTGESGLSPGPVCSSTGGQQDCYSAPVEANGIYTYVNTLSGLTGSNSVVIPLLDPHGKYGVNVTDSNGTNAFNCSITDGTCNSSGGLNPLLITDPALIAGDWPAGQLTDSDAAFANPVALLAVPENGEANLTISIDSNDTPMSGPMLLAESGSLATGGAILTGPVVLDPALPGAIETTPEPGTLVLLGAALAALGCIRRRF